MPRSWLKSVCSSGAYPGRMATSNNQNHVLQNIGEFYGIGCILVET